jgi:hypothetical protein
MVAAEPKSIGIELKASVASRVNAAFHANSVPAIAEIEIINDTENALTDVSVLVASAPGFLKPKMFRLDRVGERGTERLNPVPVELDPGIPVRARRSGPGRDQHRTTGRGTDHRVACGALRSAVPVRMDRTRDGTGAGRGLCSAERPH